MTDILNIIFASHLDISVFCIHMNRDYVYMYRLCLYVTEIFSNEHKTILRTYPIIKINRISTIKM